MQFLQAVVLGIVQGITEFLPVSSDGHLILVPSLLGWDRFGLGFDVVLHAGTLLATILYFRSDLWSLARAAFSKAAEQQARARKLAWMVVASAVPSVVVVLALEPFVDGVEARPVTEQIAISALGLLATSAVLAVSELIARRRSARAEGPASEDLSWGTVLGIGFAQGFAALPGLSRSGTTIATGQALGMERGEAARFSFLISVPIIAAATAKKMLDIVQGQGSLPPVAVTLLGLVVTTLVGYAAIAFLLPFVRRHSLGWFAAYTGIAGILLLARYAF